MKGLINTGISIFKINNSGTEQIDIKSAFNVWKTLDEAYRNVQDAQMLLSFVHDRDLGLFITRFRDQLNKQVKLLEKEVETYSLIAPDRPPKDSKTYTKINEFTDKFIFAQGLNSLLTQMYSLSLTVRTTLTTDDLRKMFVGFLIGELKEYKNFYKYGNKKGWHQVTPAYKTAKPQMNEELSSASAYHIWDHIRVRYYNLQLTQFFQGFAHDTDFKAGMIAAVRTLEKQITKLEQMANKYQVPLPERPPVVMKVAVDPEVMQDKFMYQQLFLGIDNMVEIHMRAVIEATRTNDVNDVFVKLFEDELDIHDSMIKYGKMKGWLAVPPVYAQGVNAL